MSLSRKTEACRLIRAAAHKLLDLEFEASALFYKTGTHQQLSHDVSNAMMDVIAAYGAHMGWNQAAQFDARYIQKRYDPRVRAIITKLASDLEAIVFAQYPGGVEEARRDFMRGRIVILWKQNEAAKADEIRDALDKAKSFDWKNEPHVVSRLNELEARLSGIS